MRKIRMGMVGGGQGAFIGAIHRIAAAMDGQIDLVCGAFSQDPQKSLESGLSLYLNEDRCYASYQDMFVKEAKLPADKRMDFVAIVTPNHLHFPVAQMALESGFHVMSDKPATFNLAEAQTLKALVEKSDCLYGLTHTYTGYPMVKEMRAIIANNNLGQIKKVVVEYPQGWLAEIPSADNKQARWRLDPKQSGISCCMGDIGVHAANLVEYICQDEISHISADLSSSYDERLLDDDGTVLFKLNSGCRGILIASQISVGEENNLNIRIYGEKASLEWRQQEPNTIYKKYADRPTEMLRAGVGKQSVFTQANLRTPNGHPEGYLEAFANIYKNFAKQIQAKLENKQADDIALDIPGIDEAVRGMAFIQNVVEASQSTQKWHKFNLTAKTISAAKESTQ